MSCREEGGQGAPGDPPTVGPYSRTTAARRGCWDYHGFDVRDGDVEDQGRPARQHSRTKPRDQDEKGARAGFFLLLAAKVRSSCEEGPGQSALQSAYHDPQLDVTELKQHRTT